MSLFYIAIHRMQQSAIFFEATVENQGNAGEDSCKWEFCVVTSRIAEIVVNIHDFFEQEKKQQKRSNVNQVVKMTANYLQISESLVYKVAKKKKKMKNSQGGSQK